MTPKQPQTDGHEVDDKCVVTNEFVQLARLALAERRQDVELFLRRSAKRYRSSMPTLAERLVALLRDAPTRSSPLRRDAAPTVPVDLDTRLQLIRTQIVHQLEVEPVYAENVWASLRQLVAERRGRDALMAKGLAPTRTSLFTGPPGVGKTLAAKWLARELDIPLVTLDLSAVMSSFLGRTGNNLRYVLDYAKDVECILLLDEFDAIAKRRDDTTEVGELKRLVTVLLQEIDDWPPIGLLIAATNHPDLLDPAVWRRFELAVEFPMPDAAMVTEAIRRFLDGTNEKWVRILSILFRTISFSGIERKLTAARRAAAVSGTSIDDVLVRTVRDSAASLPRRDRILLATELVSSGVSSQRDACNLTGVSRDTIRKTTSLKRKE